MVYAGVGVGIGVGRSYMPKCACRDTPNGVARPSALGIILYSSSSSSFPRSSENRAE